MVILALVLLLAGAVIVLLGLFTADASSDNGKATIEIANVNLSPEGVFLAGVVATLLILAGLWALKLGAKQGWRRRKEQKKMAALSEKLDRAEADRRHDDEDDLNG
ncbi:hypothetical protein [Nocardioides sp. MH1]|uniref:hypothetical protein n=1 Tax=Nocardioides sp. MH1 TaxID=3242490 RepID=UPI0035215C8D